MYPDTAKDLRKGELRLVFVAARHPGDPAIIGVTRRPVVLRHHLSVALPFSVAQNMHQNPCQTQGHRSEKNNMPPGKPTLLKDLLCSQSLADLSKRAASTDTLARQIQSILPEDIASHVVGTNIRGNQVIVIVDGPAWAARVRFEAATVCRVLREQHEIDVTRMRVRVHPLDSGQI